MHPAVAFDVLGLLPNNAARSHVSKRFKELALIFHPDKGGVASEFRLLKLAEETAAMYLAKKEMWCECYADYYQFVSADFNGLRFALSSATLRSARADIPDAARNREQLWTPAYVNLKAFVKECHERTVAMESKVSALTSELDDAKASRAEFQNRAFETSRLNDNDWDVDMSRSELPRTWPKLPPSADSLKSKLVRKFNSLKVRRSQCRRCGKQASEAAIEKEIAKQTARIWAVHRRFK